MTPEAASPWTTVDFVGFGLFLRAQRQGRGLSVDDVARSTKIPPTLIGALEDGQADRFPEQVFVLNYVRSYARAVGLSPDDAVARFQDIPGAPQPTSFDPAALEEARRESALTRAWWFAAVVSWVALGLAWATVADRVLRYASR
jgi:cytoskeletal protein RodZ